jgi:hypothetical protein
VKRNSASSPKVMPNSQAASRDNRVRLTEIPHPLSCFIQERRLEGEVGPTRKDKGVAVIATTPWVTGRARGGGNGRPAVS